MPLERDHEDSAVDAAHERAEILVGELQQILEDEHLILDRLGDDTVALGQRLDDALLAILADIVHDRCSLAGAAALARGAAAAGLARCGLLEYLFQIVERLGTHRTQCGEAMDDVILHFGRQELQHGCRRRRIEMRQHDRHDLRMLDLR